MCYAKLLFINCSTLGPCRLYLVSTRGINSWLIGNFVQLPFHTASPLHPYRERSVKHSVTALLAAADLILSLAPEALEVVSISAHTLERNLAADLQHFSSRISVSIISVE